MANLRGIINRFAGGAASGRRTGGTPGPGRVGGPAGGGGRRSQDEAIGRGVRGLLSKLGGRR